MAEKRNSDAKISANNKYSKKHYDRINMALPKGSRPLIEYCAKQHGESVNRYVCRVVLEAVREELKRERPETPKPLYDREFYELF